MPRVQHLPQCWAQSTTSPARAAAQHPRQPPSTKRPRYCWGLAAGRSAGRRWRYCWYLQRRGHAGQEGRKKAAHSQPCRGVAMPASGGESKQLTVNPAAECTPSTAKRHLQLAKWKRTAGWCGCNPRAHAPAACAADCSSWRTPGERSTSPMGRPVEGITTSSASSVSLAASSLSPFLARHKKEVLK